MQKTLLSTTALLITAGIAVPAFAQWTISAGVQSTQLEVESRFQSSLDSINGNQDYSRNDQATGIGGELAVGYQYNFDTTYNVALEAFGQLSDAQVRTQGMDVDTTNGDFQLLDPQASITWIAGLRLRPGFFVTPSTRVFLDGGVVVGGLEVEQNDDLVATIASETGQTLDEEDVTTLWGWRYGAGAEHKFTENFLVGLDYTITEFDDYKSEFAQDASSTSAVPGTQSVHYTPTLHTLGLNFKYLFGASRHVQHHHYEMKDE